jgi:hypothetical protein
VCTQRHKKKAESFEKNALEKNRETEAVSPAGRVKNKKKHTLKPKKFKIERQSVARHSCPNISGDILRHIYYHGKNK